jgi:hypothetical protein
VTSQQHTTRGRPRFEQCLHPLESDEAWFPTPLYPGNVLRRWLPQPLLVFSLESRGTLVLPVYEGEGQITSPAIFFDTERGCAIGPLLIADTQEGLVAQAFARFQLTREAATVPADQRVGDYHGIRFFRLSVWPEPLYLLGPAGRSSDTLAIVALRGVPGIPKITARVVRWHPDEAEASQDEEIGGNSLDQVFARLLSRYRRWHLIVFWLMRIGAWVAKAVASVAVLAFQLFLACLIWWLAGRSAHPPLVTLALALTALCFLLGGSLLILQPLLFPRFPPTRTRRGRVARTALMVCLPVLESAALAYLTVAYVQPATAGIPYFDAWQAWFLPLFVVTVIEWGIEVMFRDQSPARSRTATEPHSHAPG